MLALGTGQRATDIWEQAPNLRLLRFILVPKLRFGTPVFKKLRFERSVTSGKKSKQSLGTRSKTVS